MRIASLLAPLCSMLWTAALAAGFQHHLPPQDFTVVPAQLGQRFYQPIDPEQLSAADEEALIADQQPLVAESSTASVDRTKVHFDERAGEIWAVGSTYKASVATDGFTYVPFLGSNAPRNYPVRFRLEHATLGGAPLALPTSGRIERSGSRLLIHRGPIEVRYDTAAEHVEQSFAIDAAGRDASLVLELSVEASGLSPRPQDGGYAFDGPLGGIRYGAATVLDEAGLAAPVPMEFVGNTLRLTVPASFLREACGQVVVDPIVSSYSIDDTARERMVTEIAYDYSSNQFLHVFEERFSWSDRDIMAVAVHANTGALRQSVYVDATAETWLDPKVANLNHADVSVIVARQAGSPVRIMGRTFAHTGPSAANSPVGPPFVVSPGLGDGNSLRFDIGGNSSMAPNARCMAVWNARDVAGGWHVFGRTISSTGARGSIIQLTSGQTFTSRPPAISESTGNPSSFNLWNVAFPEAVYTNGNATSGVGILQLNASGNIVTPYHHVPVPGGANPGTALVDVSDSIRLHGRHVFAVITRVYGGGGSFNLLQIFDGATLLSTREYTDALHMPTSGWNSPYTIATTGSEFVVARHRRTSSTYSTAVITSFDVTSDFRIAISERDTILDPGYASTYVQWVPSLASRFSGGMYASRYTGASFTVGQAGNHDVLGATHFASNPFSCGEQYCFGEPNSTGEFGFARLTGSPSASSIKTLHGESLPPSVFALPVIGDGFANYANPVGPGRMCVGGITGYDASSLGVVDASGTITFTIDPSSLPRGSGSVVGLAGQRWQMTIWHQNASGGSYDTNYTNAVSVFFD